MLMTDLEEFHHKFGLYYSGKPRELPSDLAEFRAKFMFEELYEYCTAKNNEDRLDALVDLCYVAIGTAQMHGFDFHKAWKIVHKANMAKIRKPSGRSEYDIVKPEGWTAPDLSSLV